MILVTLGTQDKTFTRLLEKTDEQLEKGNIKGEVVVQAGYTKFNSKYMKILDLVDRDEFQNLITKCDLLITHGGVGSILSGLKKNKKVIVCPRLFEYGEHMNNHQIQIVSNFEKAGYLLGYQDGDDLGEILKKVKKFKPKKFVSNTEKMISLIDNFIEEN